MLEHLPNLKFHLLGAFPQGDIGGLLLNVILAVLSLGLSFLFGVIFGYSRLSSRLYVKIPCIAYIETIRAIPLIVIILSFYIVVPALTGIELSIFWSVIISLCIYAAAYQAEIVRSGISSVSGGQLEAALSTGLTRYESMGFVILPQAFRMMAPSFVSYTISLFKDTSTVFLIGMMDLTQTAVAVSKNQPEKAYGAYLTIAVGFFIVCYSLSLMAKKLEKRIGVFDFQSYRPDITRDEFMLFPKYKLQTRPVLDKQTTRKKTKKYGMLIDLNKCVGCHSCQVTCKAEHDVPYGAFRCNVETYQSGHYPNIKKNFLPRLCNQCEHPPCIDACDEKDAIHKTVDGVVLINNNLCPKHIECKKCYELCPYDAIDIDPFNGKPEKCDFCYDRIQKDEIPVCVKSCMGKAIKFGDLNDKGSEIAQILNRRQIKTLNSENETYPLVFYMLDNSHGKNLPLRNYDLPKRIPYSKKIRKAPLLMAEKELEGVERKAVDTVCSMCPSECGISVHVENGIARKIYGNPHTLINNGTLCSKGASGLQLTYSPHRIKKPLMRAGERGEDRWKEITWEEAANHIAKKLIDIKKNFGPESVFLNTGDMTDSTAYERLFSAFGTPHLYNHGCICDPNRQWGQKLMLGDARPLPDVQRPMLTRDNDGNLFLKNKHDAKLILNIGANPFVATRFNYMSSGIPGAKTSNNCFYIVIDPSHTNSAAHADMWLPIIPGTDAALLASMLYYILTNDSGEIRSRRYIDHDFLKKYATGWSKFKKSFLSMANRKDISNNFFYFTPEWAQDKTGISKKDIKNVAHLFGITKPASIEIGMHGTAHHTNGDVTSILMVALCLITGNMDRPGGLVFISSQKPEKGNETAGHGFLKREAKRMVNGNEVSGTLSELHKDHYGDYLSALRGLLVDLPEKMRTGITLKQGPFKGHEYPVKAYIVRAGNPVITAGSTPDWIDAITAKDEVDKYKVDLFVYVDTHITATGKYADIVLPEAGYLEHMGLSNVFTMSPEVALRDQVIKPLYEAKTPYEFMIYMSEALIRNGDPDIKDKDFSKKYKNEESFIDDMLTDSPAYYNTGSPLPYPDLPEGCLIMGSPDNPSAVIGKDIVKEGDPLTVEWLRKHNGVAVWPASYYRYRKSDDSPSGLYPLTGSGKFEFKFSLLEQINRKFGTDYPTTFYWKDCMWNPKNPDYAHYRKEYPFQLITGRVHHSMTMTVVCPYLAETDTECMDALNDEFQYAMPSTAPYPNKYSLPADRLTDFKEGKVSIPVFAMNRTDGNNLNIKTGDIVTLESPLNKRIKGKALLTDEIMPGVIKTAFGPGGPKASGRGFLNSTCDYTPNINELFDPANFNTFTGTPGFGDIMVKIIVGSPG
jgi:His/Glu/Gln/Arg/opine family amino acid ABC transporter permease subunit